MSWVHRSALARKIIEHRQAKGWTQEDLAEIVGVSRQSITNWEVSRVRPTMEHLYLLGVAFGLPKGETTDWLFLEGELAAGVKRG